MPNNPQGTAGERAGWACQSEDKAATCYFPDCQCPREAISGDADRLTCRDPDLDLAALERGHGLALVHYKAACVSASPKTAAAWEALLVASGYGWPATPKEPPHG